MLKSYLSQGFTPICFNRNTAFWILSLLSKDSATPLGDTPMNLTKAETLEVSKLFPTPFLDSRTPHLLFMPSEHFSTTIFRCTARPVPINQRADDSLTGRMNPGYERRLCLITSSASSTMFECISSNLPLEALSLAPSDRHSRLLRDGHR